MLTWLTGGRSYTGARVLYLEVGGFAQAFALASWLKLLGSSEIT